MEPLELPTQKDTFRLGFRPTAKDKKEMQARKLAEREGKQMALYIPSLHHTFPRPSGVIISELSDGSLDDGLEDGLARLFVGAIFEEEASNQALFPVIPEDSLQNWRVDCLPSRSAFR